MGARLVSLVYTRWTGLPDRPHRLLAYMALIALDRAASPVYYGGQAALADALGLPEDAPGTRVTVTRAVRALVAAGAVERVGRPHPGQRAEYRLTLDADQTMGSTSATRTGSTGAASREALVLQMGSTGATNGKHQCCPKEYTRNTRNTRGEKVALERAVNLGQRRRLEKARNSDLTQARATLDQETKP